VTRFSTRTNWNLATNEIHELVRRMRADKRPILDLTETNPTRVGFVSPLALTEFLAREDAALYAPDALGLASARESVARDLQMQGVAADSNEMFLSASTSEAYAWIFKLLCDAGDEILVPAPSYPLFAYLAGIENVGVHSYPLAREDGFRIDPDRLRASLTPRVRAIVIVHPNNPTGTLVYEEDAKAVERIAAEHGAAIVSDEVFRGFTFGTVSPTRRATFAGDRPALTFVMGGLSKSCAAPGLKLAFTTVHGPKQVVREALHRLEVIADTFLSVATPIQLALPRVLEHRPRIQEEILTRLRANLRALDGAVADGGAAIGIRRLQADGGWSAILEVPRTEDEATWVRRLLVEDGVLVHPGYFFDMHAEGYLVVSLLPEEAPFRDGVARLVRRLASA
jgi:aspartate/methionine/tyrosine aminotransferase